MVSFLLQQNVLHLSIPFRVIVGGKPIGSSQISMLLLVSTWFIRISGRFVGRVRLGIGMLLLAVVSFVIIRNGMENVPEIGSLHNSTLMVCFPTAPFLVHWVKSEPTLKPGHSHQALCSC